MSGMKELIGKRCRVVFSLPSTQWPIPGYPAWANCYGVDGCMIKLDGVWYNTAIIREIESAGDAI